MATIETAEFVGTGVDRVDGPLKVAGAAHYANDVSYPTLVHAVVLGSTVAAGRISRIDTGTAEAASGVVAVFTHLNAPRLRAGPRTDIALQPPPALQHDRILYYGQHIALVVAETFEQATAAAALIEVEYERAEPVLDPDDPRAERLANPWHTDCARGDVEGALAAAHLRFTGEFRTPDQTNNPLGPFSTVAKWDGDSVTVHDTTQHPDNVRAAVAGAFDLPEERVRVLARYVGGGFGAGLRVWQHVILAAMAARLLDRPVKLVLTRPQMFTCVGHRPYTIQHIEIGATREGELVAVEHRAVTPIAREDDVLYRATRETTTAYAYPNLATHDWQVRLNIPSPAHMRAPGTAEGNFALESMLDEISHQLGLDPIELRLRNYATMNPQLSLPWSSKALRDCYLIGAERFGWDSRVLEPGSMREGPMLIGYGMAGVSYGWFQPPCQARATVYRDGTAYVRSAATDIGTGTYTVMTQLSAELLGLQLNRVRFDLGDTDMPTAPQAGGSGLTGALGAAVHDACNRLVRSFLDLVHDDPESPLRGARPGDVLATNGRIHRVDDSQRGETYTDILSRHGREELSADGAAAPAKPEEIGLAPAGAFGAKFVEVRIDPDLGVLRVARVVSAIDGGRILNGKLARSQIIGGTVGGIGMAILEQTVTDPDSGRIANANLGDYLVPVNADVPEMEVVFVGEPDGYNPVGVKGIGEIGIVGIAAAIANAVFHATGRRIRSLPITLDRLL